MFDKCAKWKALLAQRAEGSLPAAQAGALDFHLTGCSRCKAIAQADYALLWGLRLDQDELPHIDPELFETEVLAILRRPAPSWRSRLLAFCGSLPAMWRSPVGLPYQLVGGAACAAVLTLWCVMPEGRPVPPALPGAHHHRQTARAVEQDPPVPFESLFRTPTPRAALLWATPPEPRHARTTPRRPVPNQRGNLRSHGEQQGMTDGPANLG
jgi:hypothetical protein